MRTYRLNAVPTADLPRFLADKFAKRCWSTPQEDFRQQAAMIALESASRIDPAKGDGRGYVYTAVTRGLMNYSYQASPVKGDHAALKEVRSVEFDETDHVTGVSPADALQATKWPAAVRARVVALAWPEAHLVVPVLLDEESPMSVAARERATLTAVVAAVVRVRAAMADDQALRDLWEESW